MSAAPRPAGDLRAAGYRLLGARLDYLLHLRPAEWPIVAAHTAIGYLLAVGLRGAAAGERLGAALAGIGLWVVCLNGGTLAINSAFDRDEGDVAYLRRPPPPPPRLFAFGLGLMLVGQAAAFALPAAYTAAYAVCLLLSLAYSVPPVRLKAVAGADWLINMVGFGALTAFAGYAATGRPLALAPALALLAFCPLFAALYPLTQLYQMDEDRRRGDRTLAIRLGLRGSLLVAVAAAVLAFTTFIAAGMAAEWHRDPAGEWRWAGLAAAGAVWAAVLGRWLARYPAMDPGAHQRGMYLALGAWAVTDLVVAVAWAG